MLTTTKIYRRLDSLELKMESLEASHKEIIEQIKPLNESIAALKFIAQVAAFLTVLASGVAAVAAMLHR